MNIERRTLNGFVRRVLRALGKALPVFPGDVMPVIPAGALSPQGGWQLRPNDGQGLLTPYFANYIARKVEPWFYEFLREAIPVIDAAIRRLVSLDGHLVVKGNNAALVEEIREWMHNVKVNDIQTGLQAFHQSLTNEAFEQGFALGEWVVNEERDDITGLRTGDSKFVRFQRTPKGVNIFQRSDTDVSFRELRREQLIYFSIDNENQNPYGCPLFRSCEFVAKILATMQNALGNQWERFGDPSFSVIYKTSKKDGMDLEARRKTLETDLNTAVRAKREGRSADFVRAIDTNSEIEIDVIGAKGEIMSVEEPARHVLEQIIAKSGLPPWMLGMHWSSTQALAGVEVEVLKSDIATRQAAKMPHFHNLVRNLLLLRGRTWKRGDWWLEWAQVNLVDIEKQARARFLNAQADMMSPASAPASKSSKGSIEHRAKAAESMEQGKHGAKGSKTLCSLLSAQCSHAKELRRSVAWPALDKVENAYADRLASDWSDLHKQVLTILELPASKSPHGNGRAVGVMGEAETEAVLPLTRTSSGDLAVRAQGAGSGFNLEHRTLNLEQSFAPCSMLHASSAKADDDLFSFTEEQRSAIMQAMRQFIGRYDSDDADSPVRKYYGQAYSLGLIQAATLAGKERPILDLIKNSQVYDQLCTDGFALVKDDATKSIVQRILPEMEAQTLAGTNPRHVATRLESLFGSANSDWERLARTEMTSAAEGAKLDEWGEEGTKRVDFVPSPDACEECQALAGEYDIDSCPIPGIGTHPRCRCSTAPVAE